MIKGKRSPRWALMSRMVIPDKVNPANGDYLRRLRIVQTPWFGIFVHHILRPDGDPDPHDHPWSFWSLVLRGGYTESLYELPSTLPLLHSHHRRSRWSLHHMGRGPAHQITTCAPGTVTLILVGKRHDGWGFYTASGKIPWQDYDLYKRWKDRRPAANFTDYKQWHGVL